MYIRIISVGNKPRPDLQSLITTYETRLPRSIRVEWVYIKHSSGVAQNSMLQEAEKILKAIPTNYMTILLDESGKQLTSEKLSKLVFEQSDNVCFVIGGAYGVSNNVKEKADFILSLSEMVFPHQIARLVLTEQIYRCHCIASGHPYHHD